MNYKEALEAIRARIEGEFDNEALQSFGVLSNNTLLDIKEIINLAFGEGQ